jgi:acyl carrier protein
VDEQAAFAIFRRHAAAVLVVPEARIVPAADLATDLGADSIDLLELIEEVRSELGVEVDDEELEKVRTVGDVFALIAIKLA